MCNQQTDMLTAEGNEKFQIEKEKLLLLTIFKKGNLHLLLI